MTVLDLDRPIGIARPECVEKSEMIGDGLTPDLRMKLLRLGDEHSTRLLQRQEDTGQTPAPSRLVEDGMEQDVGLHPGAEVLLLGELGRHTLCLLQLRRGDLSQRPIDGEPFQ
jgi:hypothetical protein